MKQQQRRTRVKFCGLTRKEDVKAAVAAGADALGFVLYPKSKRALTLEQAVALREQVPAFITVTALVVNATDAHIREILAQLKPDLLQFHGDETVEQCERYNHPYMRAIRVGGPTTRTANEVLNVAKAYHTARAWLFDTYAAGYGGSGRAFDYDLLTAVQESDDCRPLVLAGGLQASTVGTAISCSQPYAVDVSSAIETAPGIKSAALMQDFITAVSKADEAHNPIV